MVMQSPVPAAPGPEKPAPRVAPAKAPSTLKGTMVGVAPPGMDDLRKQIAEARQSPERAAVTSHLKGTMIGLAPPDPGGDIQPTLLGVAPPGSSAPPPAEPATASAQPAPSRLKGTMVGVAPPNLGPNVQSPDAFSGTFMAGATMPMTAVAPFASAIGTANTEPSPPPSGEPGPPSPVADTAPLAAPRSPAPEARVGARYPTSDPAPSLSAGLSKSRSSQLPIILLIGLIVLVALALVAFGLVMRGGDEEEGAAPASPTATSSPSP